MDTIIKEIREWLTAHVVVRLLLARVVPALLGALLGVLAAVGLVDPAALAACRVALGL